MAKMMGYKITNLYFITTIAIVGGALFGFDIAGMSAILGTDQYKCYFNQGPHGPPYTEETDCSGPTPTVQGGITASMPGGSLVGSLISGYLSDMIGRKTSIQYGSVIWYIGCVITCACQNIPMLCVGRFINGLAVGVCSAQVPVYVSELAPPSKRGRVVGAQQWALTWGMIVIFYISYGTSFLKGTASFRIPWGLQAIPGILLGVGLCFAPESPRYLARNDRWEEAEMVLAAVHSKGDRNSPFVQRELLEIRAACHAESTLKSSYLDLFKKDMIYRTHVGMFTQIWSQLTGMNALMYYITYIFGMAGLTGSVNLYSSSIQYVINMIVTVPTLIWVDRWGRRWPIVIGSIFMALWMFLCGGLMGRYGSPAPPGGLNNVPQESWQIQGPASKAVIASTYMFVATYGMTLAPISWIYCAELFPLYIRGKAVSVTTAANWIFNFALSWFVPSAFVNIKWKTFILFGCFLVTMTLHFFFCFPETSGKTLEEIEEIFKSKTPAWRTHVGIAHARQLEATGVAADDTINMKEAVEHATHVEVSQTKDS